MDNLFLKVNEDEAAELVYRLSRMVVTLVIGHNDQDNYSFCRLCGNIIADIDDINHHTLECEYRLYHEFVLSLKSVDIQDLTN